MRRYGVKQHLIVLNLTNVSVNKIIDTEFITVEVSKNLNLMSCRHSEINYFVFKTNRMFFSKHSKTNQL